MITKIKLGYVPTRRGIFSAPDVIKYRGLTAKRLQELGIGFVDIMDISKEGLFLPYCNFGTEYKDTLPPRTFTVK